MFFKLRDYGVVFLGEREKRDGTVNVKLRVHMEGEDVGDGPASVIYTRKGCNWYIGILLCFVPLFQRTLKFKRLHVLEFDSDRKCMSVIVQVNELSKKNFKKQF